MHLNFSWSGTSPWVVSIYVHRERDHGFNLRSNTLNKCVTMKLNYMLQMCQLFFVQIFVQSNTVGRTNVTSEREKKNLHLDSLKTYPSYFPFLSLEMTNMKRRNLWANPMVIFAFGAESPTKEPCLPWCVVCLEFGSNLGSVHTGSQITLDQYVQS